MRSRYIFLALLLSALAAAGVWAQDDDVIKVDTKLVSVPVIVTDRDGRYIADLTTKDFGILHDGELQPIEFFGTTDEPLTVAILIDTSHSTRPVLGDIKDAARSFIKLLTPRDQAMIVTFDNETRILSGLTSDPEKLKKAIKDAAIPDPIGTKMRDAIYQTAFESFAGLTGRKAIIVLTDGQDGGSSVTLPKLLLKLQETDTLIYPIQFRTQKKRAIENMLRTGTISQRDAVRISGDRPTRESLKADHAAGILKDLAMVSAGRFMMSDTSELKKAFETILDELRRQYRLGYYPPESSNGRSVHEIRVRIARPGLVVRARGSYRNETAVTP